MLAVGSVVDAVESGDRRRVLEELALKLAAEIDSGPEPRDLAALVLRLERVTEELKAVPVPQGGVSWEERLAARRKAREAAAS